jgi:hypothetical protein
MAEPPQEVLFEFKQIGRSVKVTAIDARTGTEASIVGPAGGTDSELKRVALAKLQYVLAKQAGKR